MWGGGGAVKNNWTRERGGKTKINFKMGAWGERRKLLCEGEREGGKKKIIVYGGARGRKEENYCARGSLRAETRKLLCEGEREGGNKKIIVCGGA